MKHLVLKSTETYDSHIVFQETNNFGDQILTLRVEKLDGSFEYFHSTNSEGCWVPFTKDWMIKAEFSYVFKEGT